MSKLPYNCYIDNKGYVMPKSAAIKNCKEIIDWLSTNYKVKFMFTDKPNTLNLEGEWLVIGISHSYIGNIYCHTSASENDWFEKYEANNPYIKVFDDDYNEFMKYLTWVGKLGPKFTKQLINKN